MGNNNCDSKKLSKMETNNNNKNEDQEVSEIETSNSTEVSKTKRVFKVVLTGGPCGGKTTGQSRLSTFFETLGWKVFRVPEAALILLGGGVLFSELSPEQGAAFQENLLKTMMQLEDTYFRLAETWPEDCLVICDRGIMDASVFVPPQEWEAMMEANNLTMVEHRDSRYDQVIHLVSAANGAEAFYTTEGNVARGESLEFAAELDERYSQVWLGHPYFDVIDNSTSFEDKLSRMIDTICHCAGVDTGDRLAKNARKIKFLVEGPLPEDDVYPDFQDFDVEHVYLASGRKTLQQRVRKRGFNGQYSYTHTVRDVVEGQVIETRKQVSARDWATLTAQRSDTNHGIYKKRRCFVSNAHYFQLDIFLKPYHERCENLVLLETYTTLSGSEVQKRLPSFLKGLKEVTGVPEYSMYNLSRKDGCQLSQAVKKPHLSNGFADGKYSSDEESSASYELKENCNGGDESSSINLTNGLTNGNH